MNDPDRWQPKDILSLVGWICIFSAAVLIFPGVGAGTGQSHEPGSDTFRGLAFEHSLVVVGLVVALVGVVAPLISKFMPDRS